MLQRNGTDEHVAGRRRTIGAEPDATGSSFRVWAPRRQRLSVVLDDGTEHPLERGTDGHHAGRIEGVGAGARYRFRLDGDHTLYPDPASRFQPEGPHGPSQIVDPGAFRWSDRAWPGIRLPGQVVYEMHVGTFTPEGNWAGASAKLPFLKDVGITVVEVMPVAEFPGRFGWGYDGVDLYAPTHLYGTPDDMRSFVDAAHALGIAVILDVVYNHLGPDGNYLACFCSNYFSKRHETEWGEALNFDDEGSGPVRAFFVENAAYWIDEFHFDGLRLDATQSIFDDGPVHVLVDINDAARAAAGSRSIIMVAENEPQHTRLVRPVDQGGYGLDGLWNDDFHHSAMVALTGRAEAYYEDHAGSPQEFISCAKYGYLMQGEFYFHQGAPRGTAGLDLPPSAFVTFIQNPRPGSELRFRPALPDARPPGPGARDDRADIAHAGHPDAVPGPGIRRHDPVLLLRRSRPRAGGAGTRRPPRVHGPVPECGGRSGAAGHPARSGGDRDVRTLPARLVRASSATGPRSRCIVTS